MPSSHERSDSENDDYFIVMYEGDLMDRMSKSFATAKTRAEVTRKLPPYAFRHSFLTNLLSAGNLKRVSEIAGHSRIDTTTRIYQHTTWASSARKSTNFQP